MRSRPFLRWQAVLLLALLGATSISLPSHHHADESGGPVLADAGHHGHGVRLIDPPERLTSSMAYMAPAARTAVPVRTDAATLDPIAATPRLLPRERAPPSARPRAPPVPA